jgi:hypothetical protein
MNKDYPKEMDEAQKLFWANMMANMKSTTARWRAAAEPIERRLQQIHVEIERRGQQVDHIEKNTEDMPWLSKFIGNLFKYGGSQAEQKYPSKKK